ncbi:MAG: hypothetical protein ACHQPI_11560 [Thermoanaerobaculia bacterium]
MTGSQGLQLFLEFFKAFGLPHALVILVPVVLFMFRNQIRSAIDRGFHVKAGPIDLEARGLNQGEQEKRLEQDGTAVPPLGTGTQQSSTSESSRPATVPPLPPASIPVAQEIERVNKVFGVVPSDVREEYLTRALAEARTRSRFQRIERVIFGSQQQALLLINTAPQTTEALRKLFDGAKGNYPDVFTLPSAFERWLGFLKQMELITEEAGTFQITATGREFMKFVVDSGLTVFKPA